MYNCIAPLCRYLVCGTADGWGPDDPTRVAVRWRWTDRSCCRPGGKGRFPGAVVSVVAGSLVVWTNSLHLLESSVVDWALQIHFHSLPFPGYHSTFPGLVITVRSLVITARSLVIIVRSLVIIVCSLVNTVCSLVVMAILTLFVTIPDNSS